MRLKSASSASGAPSTGAEIDALFAAHYPRLRRYLERSCGDSAIAEDAAQEAFVRLIDRGTLPADPVAWLITVASNLVRDEQRRTTRRIRLIGTAPTEAHPATTADPADEAVRGDERRVVREALDRLTHRDRQLLLLRHSGFSYGEIAAALEMPATSVGTTLARANNAFRLAYREVSGAAD